jgi:hypothetical protein
MRTFSARSTKLIDGLGFDGSLTFRRPSTDVGNVVIGSTRSWKILLLIYAMDLDCSMVAARFSNARC